VNLENMDDATLAALEDRFKDLHERNAQDLEAAQQHDSAYRPDEDRDER